jgi:hypothetical protein
LDKKKLINEARGLKLTSSQLELSPQSDALIILATGNSKWVERLAGTAQLH